MSAHLPPEMRRMALEINVRLRERIHPYEDEMARSEDEELENPEETFKKFIRKCIGYISSLDENFIVYIFPAIVFPADTTARTPELSGKSLLELAILANQPELVAAMLNNIKRYVRRGSDAFLIQKAFELAYENLPETEQILRSLIKYCNGANLLSYKQFHAAVARGNVAAVKLWLQENVLDPNMRQFNSDENRYSGDPAILIAAKLGHLEVVRELLRAGADPDVKAEAYGSRTALSWAIEQGEPGIVQLLLDAKERKRSIKTDKLITYLERIESYLYHNRDPVREAKLDQISAMLKAKLAQHGVTYKTKQKSARFIGLQKTQALQNILKAINANDVDALAGFINMLGHTEKTKLFKSFQLNPLIEASKKGKKECLILLLEQPEIDVNVRVYYAGSGDCIYTPLTLAVLNGHAECVEALLLHPDINPNLKVRGREYADDAISYETKTALMIAVFYAKPACAAVLLKDPRVDINALEQGYYEGNALIYIIDRLTRLSIEDKAAIVKNLLARVDLDINKDSKKKIAKYLESHRAEADNPLVKEFLKHPDLNPEATAEQLREHLVDVRKSLADQLAFVAKLHDEAKAQAIAQFRSKLNSALAKVEQQLKHAKEDPRKKFYNDYRLVLINAITDLERFQTPRESRMQWLHDRITGHGRSGMVAPAGGSDTSAKSPRKPPGGRVEPS